MWTPPRKPLPLPVAPKTIDAALLHQLIADRAQLHGWAVTLVPRCAYVQRSVTRGGFYTRKELATVQRQSRTVLTAARAHRELDVDTLAALDGLTAFVSGITMTGTSSQVAA